MAVVSIHSVLAQPLLALGQVLLQPGDDLVGRRRGLGGPGRRPQGRDSSKERCKDQAVCGHDCPFEHCVMLTALDSIRSACRLAGGGCRPPGSAPRSSYRSSTHRPQARQNEPCVPRSATPFVSWSSRPGSRSSPFSASRSGIGANVALFSVVNSVFLRPLPYREPDRLVRLSSTSEAEQPHSRRLFLSPLPQVQQRQQVFSDLALSVGNAFTLTGRADPEQLIGLQASAALLPALGIEPLIGRNFSAERGSARRRARRADQPRHLAAALQPRSVGPRPGAHARRRALHHHRRAARKPRPRSP